MGPTIVLKLVGGAMPGQVYPGCQTRILGKKGYIVNITLISANMPRSEYFFHFLGTVVFDVVWGPASGAIPGQDFPGC